ncbi:MAG: Gfo/Idh/MocA family oxidoreductase [Anaerolineaceae bacterium]|nr:Gfo/Idh/MocA family oxidoreductase [Anaerolineaceae bacterium]
MVKKFKVGVVGAGFIGPAHMEAIRRQGFEVLAIGEANQELAEAAAEQLLVPKAYSDFNDLVADQEIDVVHIASPNFLHFRHAKAALEAGKHVLCEKPLAMTTEESEELVHLAEEKGLVNAVNFSLRYYPLVQEAKARVAAGEFGDRIYIIQGSYLQDWLLYDTDWNWRLEPELGGALRAVADIGSHWMDLVTFITGAKIQSVFADFETFLPVRRKPTKKIDTFGGKMEVDMTYEEKEIRTEDYASVLFKFTNGARGVMTVSQVSSGRKNRLFFEIDGSDSSVVWNSEVPNELLIGHRPEPNQLLIKDPSLMSEPARWTASYPGGHAEGFPDTFKHLQMAVYRYIAAGDYRATPDFPTFRDGHNIALVDEAILKSARESRWVDVVY